MTCEFSIRDDSLSWYSCSSGPRSIWVSCCDSTGTCGFCEPGRRSPPAIGPQHMTQAASSSRYDLNGRKSFMSVSALRAASGTSSELAAD